MKTTTLTLASVAAVASVASTRATRIFNYESGADVDEHVLIDLDVAEIDAAAKEFLDTDPFNTTGFAEAQRVFAQGSNSKKDDGSLRTIEGFSSGLPAKADALQAFNGDLLAEYPLFTDYYGDDLYASLFVTEALEQRGHAEGLEPTAQAQLAIKGAQYQAVWMYVLRELYEAVRGCQEGKAVVKAWDEGVAFYTGSLINPDGTGDGTLLYTLAQKRCAAFGTCGEFGIANANYLAFDAFNKGKDAVLNGRCEEIFDHLLMARKQMQIPLIQGFLYYTLKSDAAVSGPGEFKSMAEAWAFLAGVLPFIDQVNSTNAEVIRSNLELRSGVNQTVQDGYRPVFENTYSVLGGLCITCEELGLENLVFENADDIPTCVTDQDAIDQCDKALFASDDSSSLSTGAIAGLVVAAVLVMGCLCGGMVMLSRAADEPPSARPAELKEEAPRRVDPEQVPNQAAADADDAAAKKTVADV